MSDVVERLEQLDDDELDALVDVAKAKASGKINRRQALGLLGASGVAALGGFGAGSNVIGDAKAADTSPNQVGSVGNEQDVFTDQLFDASGNAVADVVDGGNVDFKTGISGPSLNTERLGNTHVYASAFGDGETAAQSALDEHGANPATVHLDVPISALSTALTVPSNTKVLIEEDITLADSTQENIIQNENLAVNIDGGQDAIDDTNIHIRGAGGTLDGNKANQTDNGSGGYQNGVCLIGAQNCSVIGVRSNNNYYSGINFSGVDEIVAFDNLTEGNRFNGVQSHFLAAQTRPNTNVRMIYNTCLGGGDVGGQPAGIYAVGVTDHIIRGNTVLNRDNHGILVGGRGVGKGGIVVEGNTLRNVATVTNYYAETGSIMLETGQGSSETLEDVTIENNTVDNSEATDNDQHSVMVLPRGAPIRDVSIEGNHFQSVKDAVRADANGYTLEDISVSDNPVMKPATGDGRGVNFVGVTDSVISGNTIRDTGLNAIATSNVEDIAIKDNDCDGAAADGIGLLGSSTRVDAQSNRVRNSDGAGVSIGPGSVDCVVIHNDLRGNTSALSDSGTGTITDPVNQDTTENHNIV